MEVENIPHNSKRPDDAEILEALSASAGLIAPAARKLNVTRQTLYNWLREDDNLKENLNHIRESMKDLAEGKLLSLINENNITAIIFYLKTQAKDRGYSEFIDQFKGTDAQEQQTFILEVLPDTILVEQQKLFNNGNDTSETGSKEDSGE